jgi:predicted NBD/HSP70 family sugar kinase
LRNWQVIVGNSPVVLGFDFGGTKIAIAVCDLMGNRLASATVSTGAAPGTPRPVSDHGAHAIFERGIQAARDLLADAAPGTELAAVGAATFGIPFEDRIELAPAIDGWESIALGRELRSAFEGAEIRMATDAKAAAAAELQWGTLNGCDPGVYLNLGTGLAAAIVIRGQVVSGGNGAAGEIGYNLRAVSDVGRALDQRVPLEGMVSGQGLARRAAGGGGRGPSGPGGGGPGGGGRGPGGPRDGGGPGGGGPGGGERPGGGPRDGGQPGGGGSGDGGGPGGDGPQNPGARPMTAADIFEASPGDPELDDLLTGFITELAFHLVNLAICINPVRISVGGGMVRSWERLRPQLEHALRASVPFPPELVVAQFPYDAPLLGAVALAVDAAQGRTERAEGASYDGARSKDRGADGAAVPVSTKTNTMYQDTMIQGTMA